VFDFRTLRHALKRIRNAPLFPKPAIVRLSDRMRLTMQKRPRAFLFQIVTAKVIAAKTIIKRYRSCSTCAAMSGKRPIL
jgi:hypothetical protein